MSMPKKHHIKMTRELLSAWYIWYWFPWGITHYEIIRVFVKAPCAFFGSCAISNTSSQRASNAWSMDSPHNRPLMLKAVSCHKVAMFCMTLGCRLSEPMGLLPDTQNCGCACAGNAGNVFPVTAGKRSRHASRHVRHARAVMHAGIAN